jgi:iron complex outermembrane receptor protein
LNASVRYDANSDWYVSAFINNIADADVKAGSIVTSGTTGAFIIAQYLPPRTYGFKVGKKF